MRWGSYAARLRAYHAKNKAHLRTVLRGEQGAALPVAILVDLAADGLKSPPRSGPKANSLECAVPERDRLKYREVLSERARIKQLTMQRRKREYRAAKAA